jgi:hypothetical protein
METKNSVFLHRIPKMEAQPVRCALLPPQSDHGPFPTAPAETKAKKTRKRTIPEQDYRHRQQKPTRRGRALSIRCSLLLLLLFLNKINFISNCFFLILMFKIVLNTLILEEGDRYTIEKDGILILQK